MEVEIVNLTLENLYDAPEWENHPFSCKCCPYWEFPDVNVDPAIEIKEDLLRKKRGWLQNTNECFGNCGKIMYVDGRSIGYAQFAPSKYLPCSAEYTAGPTSQDAVLIACLFIADKACRGLGLGDKLLKSILDDLKERGIKAVETFARKGNPDNPSGPTEFYLRYGFRIFRDDPEFPLLRLDL